jgi:hypothetical protein
MAIVLAATSPVGCDCGANDPSWQPTDALIDTVVDTGLDVPAEVEDAPDDTGTDTVDAPEDVVEEEAVGPGGSLPFLVESAGGGTLTSEHFTMELFIAPARPVGDVSSESYGLKLGPGGTRSP